MASKQVKMTAPPTRSGRGISWTAKICEGRAEARCHLISAHKGLGLSGTERAICRKSQRAYPDIRPTHASIVTWDLHRCAVFCAAWHHRCRPREHASSRPFLPDWAWWRYDGGDANADSKLSDHQIICLGIRYREYVRRRPSQKQSAAFTVFQARRHWVFLLTTLALTQFHPICQLTPSIRIPFLSDSQTHTNAINKAKQCLDHFSLAKFSRDEHAPTPSFSLARYMIHQAQPSSD